MRIEHNSYSDNRLRPYVLLLLSLDNGYSLYILLQSAVSKNRIPHAIELQTVQLSSIRQSDGTDCRDNMCRQC